MRYKILLVDDEADNRTVFKDLLAAEDFSVILADSAREAVRAALDSRPDLILMDVAMPEEDGVSACRRLKGDPRTAAIPVVLMSGTRTGEQDQIEGMELGADDYIAKPFSHSLLAAKLRAVLRRYASPDELREALKADGILLDVHARTVSLKRRRIPLTRKEFDLLTTFIRKRGRVLSIPYLLETIWGYDPAAYNDPHTVAVHVSSLRRKLGPRLAKRIASVPGIGYRFELAAGRI